MQTFNLRDCIDKILPEKVHVIQDEAEYSKIKHDLLEAGVVLRKNESGKNVLLSAERDIKAYPGKIFFLLYQDIKAAETVTL